MYTLTIGLVDMGVIARGPIPDAEFIKSLLTGIHAHLDTDVNGEWDQKYSDLTILVGG